MGVVISGKADTMRVITLPGKRVLRGSSIKQWKMEIVILAGIIFKS